MKIDESQPPGYTAEKDALAKRMRRIEGQVRGVGRMIEEDTYCIDVLTQISAINAALHAVGVTLLHDHMSHCVADAARESPEAGEAKLAEASAAIARLIKS
ncbi:metal-sensitive transcriptional regulator [Brevibacterium rongguiense]|nr:metal-sensitive transcriptional regulator [Brevibacterium rongguiense]